jgi:hypothetical protein
MHNMELSSLKRKNEESIEHIEIPNKRARNDEINFIGLIPESLLMRIILFLGDQELCAMSQTSHYLNAAVLSYDANHVMTLEAQSRNVKIQFQRAICYHYGYGIEINLQEAARLYTLAAMQGHVQCNLNVSYQRTDVAKINQQEAVSLYTLEAEQRNPQAQCTLGKCYEYGTGVEINLQEAIRLYTLAARQQGHPLAQFYLGRCYEKGKGVEMNMQEALRLYTLSAKTEDSDAAEYLGDLFWFELAPEGDYNN